MSIKPLITKVLTRKYQFALHPAAVELIEDIFQEHEFGPDDAQNALELIAKECQKQEDISTIITRDMIERVYALVSEAASADASGSGALGAATESIDPNHHFHIIDAFEMPAWQWSIERKTFEKSNVKPSLAAGPSAQAAIFRNRHNILKQSVLRNENFSPPISGRERTAYLKISSTKNLLGRAGERFLLFGVLTHTTDGKLCLRDLEGMVVLDISQTTPSEGFYTDGCFVLVEGDYTDEETLSVIVIGHPPSERRKAAKSIYGHIDFLGRGATTVAEDEKYQERLEKQVDSPNFLVLSDLWLDHPRTLDGLRRVLDGCVEHDFIPFAFIFCGNFATRKVDVMTSEGQTQYADGFDHLADIVLSYEAIAGTSHFIFIPGPLDPWGSTTLPRPPLPPPFTSRFRHKVPLAHFPSNPCRISFFGQEIVVMRQDLMDRMLANLVGVKPDLTATDTKQYLVQTIVDQCHLSPLPLSVQPINWSLDHTLRLYPMPTTIILADSYERYELTYEGCHVFNPGNFVGNDFGFSTYFPQTGHSEASSIERDEEE